MDILLVVFTRSGSRLSILTCSFVSLLGFFATVADHHTAVLAAHLKSGASQRTVGEELRNCCASVACRL